MCLLESPRSGHPSCGGVASESFSRGSQRGCFQHMLTVPLSRWNPFHSSPLPCDGALQPFGLLYGTLAAWPLPTSAASASLSLTPASACLRFV